MIVITYKDKCRKKIVEKAFEFPYQARLFVRALKNTRRCSGITWDER